MDRSLGPSVNMLYYLRPTPSPTSRAWHLLNACSNSPLLGNGGAHLREEDTCQQAGRAKGLEWWRGKHNVGSPSITGLRRERREREKDERGEERRESSYFHRYDNTLPWLKIPEPTHNFSWLDLRHSYLVFRFRLRNCGSQSIQFSSPFRFSSFDLSTMLGSKTEVPAAANDLEVEELANYAVNEHNNQQVCPLGRWG